MVDVCRGTPLPGTTPSPAFSTMSLRAGRSNISLYLMGLETMVAVLQAGWDAVGGGGKIPPDFDKCYGTASSAEKDVIARKLWNTVYGALAAIPEKTRETERILGRLKLGQLAADDGEYFASQRRFVRNDDGSFKLIPSDEVYTRPDDCDSVASDDTNFLQLPPAVSEPGETGTYSQPDSPVNLAKFRFGESSPRSARDGLSLDHIPELVVDSPNPVRFDSFSTIQDHEVVETDKLSKSKDDDGNKMINEYVVLGDLGSGSFAKVKLVVKSDDPESKGYALKIVNKDRLKKLASYSGNRLAQLKVELAIMKKIAHPRVVKLHEVIDDPNANKVYFLLDYINGGVIAELSNSGTCLPLTPKRVSRYLKQIISALSYLHRNNIIHRDIKPSNLLVDKHDNCYLCDFGVSSIITDTSDLVDGLEGTPYFLSPELCEGTSDVHGKVADIWALGATVYTLLMGHVPFNGTSRPDIMNKIQNEAVVIPNGTDPDVRNLLRGMLNKSPRNRMTCELVKVHPFVVCEGARHPSFEGAAICISREDVLNALQMRRVGTKYPKKLTSRARAYVRRYTATIQTKVRLRRATLAREERRLRTTSPILTPLSPTPPSLNPVHKCRRFTPSSPVIPEQISLSQIPLSRAASPNTLVYGSLAQARHSISKQEVQSAWFTECSSTSASPDLLPMPNRLPQPRSLGSLSSTEIETIQSTPMTTPLRDQFVPAS
eukprot:TRINITY_DN15169_c0_g1_i1.p1 TRINITY_DN15169_c0_g1~~TRINITY_DN15169_c0_g1_i1.p1  ORF type:complete len:716 (+),score=71.48 TRINITY_DN15169_c0_g1_i1:88-2235(+)